MKKNGKHSVLNHGPHSQRAALEHGFIRQPEHENGWPLYMRDGLKWIYSMAGLKRTLNVHTTAQLQALGYDVQTYLAINREPGEMETLYQDLAVFEGEPSYMGDGMYIFPDGTIKEL